MITNNKYIKYLVVGLILVLCGITFYSMNSGTIQVSIKELFSGLFVEYNEKVSSIYHIRFPRIIIAILVGASLSMAGLLLQAVLKNPLADAGMIGISSGCQMGMLVCLMFLPEYYALKPWYGLIGGCFAFVFIYVLSYQSGFQTVRILLIGVALHYLFDGLIDVFSSTGIDNVSVNALLGNQISLQTWDHVNQIAIYLLPLLVIAFFTYRTCDLFALEEKTLISLGVNVNLKRFVLSMIAVMLVSVSVSLVGVMSFIGLIIPHMARSLVGTKHQYLFVVSGLLGAIMLLLADTCGRLIFAPYEISANLIMAIIGAPLFIVLLRRSRV